MKIEVTQYEDEPQYRQKVVIEIKDDADIHDMHDTLARLCVALGYDFETVKKKFNV